MIQFNFAIMGNKIFITIIKNKFEEINNGHFKCYQKLDHYQSKCQRVKNL